MRTKLPILIVLVVLGYCNAAFASIITNSSDAALLGAAVLDFESEAVNTYVFSDIGDVSFISLDRHLRIDNSFAGQYGTTGKYLDNGSYENMGFFSLQIEFANSTNAFGFQWGAAEPAINQYPAAVWHLNAYDTSDNLLGTYLLPNTGPDTVGAFVGLAFNDIKYATLVNTSPSNIAAGNGIGYDWIFIDNFTYTTSTSSVPEPSSVLLLGAGILGAGIMRKKFSN